MPKKELNPGESDYKDKFEGAKEINNAETKGTADSAIDDKNENLNSAEENPMNYTGTGASQKKISGFKTFMKKKAAGPAIALTLLGGGIIGIGGVAGPALLINHIANTLQGKWNESSSALDINTRKMLKNKMENVKNAFEESKAGKCNIKCKFGTTSQSMVDNLRAKGFEVETKPGLIPGRVRITQIIVPGDPDPIKDGATFEKKIFNNINNLALFNKVFRSKSAYFLNTKFGKMLSAKFGLDKTFKIKADISDKFKTKIDAIKESINRRLGLPESSGGLTFAQRIAGNEKFKSVISNIEAKGAKLSKITNYVAFFCGAYSANRALTFGVKAGAAAAFAGFVWTFLQANAQIMAGDADPDVISALGDQLTQIDGDGKSVTDSLGYKMAAYGDVGALSETDKKARISPDNGLTEPISSEIAKFGINFALFSAASLATIHFFCRKANSLIADITDVAITCIPELSVGTAGAVTIVVPVGALLSCAAKQIAMDVGASLLVAGFITAGIKYITSFLLPDVTADMVGSEAGNAMYTGTAQIMGGMSSSYGLKAGNQAEIKQYAIDTAEIKKQQADLARYEAEKTPFDIYNQYSFLGSMAQSVDFGSIINSSSPLSYFSKVLSVVPRSFAFSTDNVGAEAESKAAQFAEGQCSDINLLSIGVNADAFCNPSYVMGTDALNADIGSTVDYMIDNGYINEDTGEPESLMTPAGSGPIEGALDWSPGLDWSGIDTGLFESNNYMNYILNCSDRTAPLGETASGIDSPNYRWETGALCTGSDASAKEKEMLSNFQAYTMFKAIDDTMAEDLEAVNNGGAQNNTGGGVIVPADTLKYCTENYLKNTSQSALKSIYGSAGSIVESNLESVDFPFKDGNKKIRVHKKAAPCFKAVAQELSNVSHKPTSTAGTFYWRPNKNNPDSLSMHSFGIAIDLDAGQNPNKGGTPPNCKTNMPADFVAVWKKYGFRWGGDYKNTCDAMHYEWMGGS